MGKGSHAAQFPGNLIGSTRLMHLRATFFIHHEHSLLLLEGIIGFWLATVYHLHRPRRGQRLVRKYPNS